MSISYIENLKKLLHQVIGFAVEAHGMQINPKSGELYIAHPIRVMHSVDTLDIPEDKKLKFKMLAISHDVIEDTDTTVTDFIFNTSLPYRGIQVLENLTRYDNESYDEFIDRILTDEWAVEIKKLDIADHLARKETLSKSLETRYIKAIKKLNK
jgi:(p)ppGpp synthase/HD superfamily hydrolase